MGDRTAGEPDGAALTQPHRGHPIRLMAGRDPHEGGRTATPLELLFDLVFVVAIGQAASQLAHLVAEGHHVAGIGGFAFAMFAVIWAWINFSWFASAFDTDDWAYRLATMVQMVGVTILALGLPAMFHSLDAGHGVDTRVMVAGYIVMRVAMVSQWLRAARQCPPYRPACLAYVKLILIAQIGWVAVSLTHLSLALTVALTLPLLLLEMSGPYIAETRHGGTPWHAHHIAERYGLLAIIALGEGVLGTVASLSAVVDDQGWTTDAVLVAIAGMGLTFGMWWCYFLVPVGEVLHALRDRAFGWGYGNLVLFAGIAATGAGLHVAALYIEHEARIGPAVAVVSLAVPVGVFLVGLNVMQGHLLPGRWDATHPVEVMLTVLVLTTAVVAALAGVSMPVCLLMVMLAPAVTVISFERFGHRTLASAMATLSGD